MSYDHFTCLLCYLYCSYEWSLDYIEMVYGVSNWVITQGPRHKPCSLKSFLVRSLYGIGHSICKDYYTSIVVSYLDQAQLETSG